MNRILNHFWQQSVKKLLSSNRFNLRRQRHRLLALFILTMMPSVFAAGEEWLDSKCVNGKAYFLHDTGNPRIESYDLNGQNWGQAINLSQTPTAFHIDPDYLYVAYSTIVYRYDLNGNSATHMGNFAHSVHGLFSDGDILFINHSASSYTYMNSVNRTNGTAIDNKSTYIDSLYGSSHSPERNTFFGVSRGISPADVVRMTYNNDGTLNFAQDSPHHGDYRIGTKTFVWPDGSKMVDTTGNVYDSTSFCYLNNFATTIDDITWYGSDVPIVLTGNTIKAFSQALLETGSKELSITPQTIYSMTDQIAAFYSDSTSNNGMNVIFIATSELQASTPGEAVNPEGLAFTPDDCFIDKNDVLYLLSKEHTSLFRWNTALQDWSGTIALYGSPRYVTYSSENHTVYTAYVDGKIKKIDLSQTNPVEQPFANLPTAPRGLIAAGEFIVTSDNSGSWETHSVFNAEGTVISTKDWNRPFAQAAWSAVNRRIYHFRDDSSPNDLHYEVINADGTIGAQGETPYHSSAGIQYPIRVNPDGSVVILGSGRIYDALAMTHTGNLPNTITDATWANGLLFTYEGSKIINYTLPTYAPGIEFNLGGTGLRLLTTSSNDLIAIYLDSNQKPKFAVFDETLDLLPPTVFKTPELAIASFNASQVVLNWQDINGEEAYVVERKTEPNGDWDVINNVDMNGTAFTDSSITLNNIYSYRIKGNNDGVFSPYSNTIQIDLMVPDPVEGLSAVADNETQVTLTWQNVSYETGYTILTSTDNQNWSTAGSVSADVVQFVAHSLTRGTTYYYKVVALSELRNAAAGNTVSVTTPIYPPTAPQFNSISLTGAKQINLSWVDADRETNYLLERSEPQTAPETWITVTVLPENSTNYSDQSVNPESTYLYRLTARNDGGDSDSAFSDEVTTPVLTTPVVPAIAQIESDGKSVTITWEPAIDIDNYYIYRRIAGTSTWELIVTLPGDASSYTDQNIEAGVVYEYSLTAANSAGTSDLSATEDIAITQMTLLDEDFEAELDNSKWAVNSGSSLKNGGPSDSAQCLYFSGTGRTLETQSLSIITKGTISFDLRAGNESVDGPGWNNSEVNEEVYLQYHNGTGWVDLEVINTIYPAHTMWTRHEITLPDSFDGQDIRLRWIQPQFNPNSDHWAIDNILIMSELPLPPETPSLTVVSHEQSTPTVFWIPVETATYYVIERSEDAGDTWNNLAKVNAPLAYYSDKTATLEGDYLYRVQAGNPGGLSRPSMTSQLPTTPEIQQLNSADLSVYLSWNNVSFEDSFIVERSPASVGLWEKIAVINKGLTTFRDQNVLPDTAYDYRVKAVNEAGASPYSLVRTITTQMILPPDDDDADGMANNWEMYYFYTLNQDGDDDFDGDGFSNYQEYINGTNPASYQLELKAGWNLVSISRLPKDNSVDAIFGNKVIQHVWIWKDGRYEIATEVNPLNGYWIFSFEDFTVDINLQ